jgi:hypothetical protein
LLSSVTMRMMEINNQMEELWHSSRWCHLQCNSSTHLPCKCLLLLKTLRLKRRRSSSLNLEMIQMMIMRTQTIQMTTSQHISRLNNNNLYLTSLVSKIHPSQIWMLFPNKNLYTNHLPSRLNNKSRRKEVFSMTIMKTMMTMQASTSINSSRNLSKSSRLLENPRQLATDNLMEIQQLLRRNSLTYLMVMMKMRSIDREWLNRKKFHFIFNI